MRIVLVGDWRYEIYEAACADALEALGHYVVRCRIRGVPTSLRKRVLEWCSLRDSHEPTATATVLTCMRGVAADAIVVWRGVTLSAVDVRELRAACAAPIISYNNDDPFAMQKGVTRSIRHHLLWRTFRRAIPAYDLNLVYRTCNLEDYRCAGSPRTALWRSAYIPSIHQPPEKVQLRSGIVYIGHAEDDHRLICLRSLAEANMTCVVYGDATWTRNRCRSIGSLGVLPPVRGKDYARVLQGALIGLCFLSRQNRDTYTRRCFEIPACGAVLVAERTDDLMSLFRDDVEAVFFSDREELVSKVAKLLAEPVRAAAIAAAGLSRVRRDRHDIVSRVRDLVTLIETTT